jgi:chromate reductase, NAD(P)H dehydrogenase (quinone)
MKRKQVFAICGSTRTESVNHLILNTVAILYNEVLDLQIFTGLADLPHFNPDTGDETVSDKVQNLRSAIQGADGVLICTPEYVFSLPGSLKNALEWTVSTTVFSDKPTAIIVASSLGEKAFESLSLIMNTLGARMSDESKLLLQGVKGKINMKENRVNPDTLLRIKNVIDSLITEMNSPNGAVTN